MKAIFSINDQSSILMIHPFIRWSIHSFIRYHYSMMTIHYSDTAGGSIIGYLGPSHSIILHSSHSILKGQPRGNFIQWSQWEGKISLSNVSRQTIDYSWLQLNVPIQPSQYSPQKSGHLKQTILSSFIILPFNLFILIHSLTDIILMTIHSFMMIPIPFYSIWPFWYIRPRTEMPWYFDGNLSLGNLQFWYSFDSIDGIIHSIPFIHHSIIRSFSILN